MSYRTKTKRPKHVTLTAREAEALAWLINHWNIPTTSTAWVREDIDATPVNVHLVRSGYRKLLTACEATIGPDEDK